MMMMLTPIKEMMKKTSKSLSLFLPVKPTTKHRAIYSPRSKRYIKQPEYREWCEEVDSYLMVIDLQGKIEKFLGKSPITEGVAVDLIHCLPRPKTRKKPYPRGDVDNYDKPILDALTRSGIWEDDDQVVYLAATKAYTMDEYNNELGTYIKLTIME